MGSQQELFQSSSAIIRLEKSDRLLRVFEDIHNYVYANDGLSSQQAFDEMLKVLFIKIFNENYSKENLFVINSHELSEIEEGKKPKHFFDRIEKLQNEAFAFFSDLFEKGETIKLKSNTLAYIIEKLQFVDLSKSSRDVKGLAFQKFLYTKTRGERGQFFTPEQIVNLCVKIINPQKGQKILDPACGSAGFLSQASTNISGTVDSKDIFGIEINKVAARTAKIRMLLEGNNDCTIATTDSLSGWENINLELNAAGKNKDVDYEGFFDVILTNPPFGTQGKIADKSVLKTFTLGHKWNEFDDILVQNKELQNGQVPDILFIERCLDFLKDGGKLAMVLPNGDLENSSLNYVRKYIDSNAKILAVINLPSETFIPFGTGVKASIIFLQKLSAEKLSAEKKKNYKIFFGRVTKLGYQGNKNGSRTYKKDDYGNIIYKNQQPIVDEDISMIVDSYEAMIAGRLTENSSAFSITYSHLGSRYDFDYYKPEYRKLEKMLVDAGAQKLGELIILKKNKSTKLKDPEKSVQYVELSDINPDYSEISNSAEMLVHELPSRATFQIEAGDIITAVAGNSIGSRKHASAMVSENYSGCICTNGFRVFKTKNGVNPYYLLYYLKSELFLKQVFKYRTGAAIPAISDGDFLNILVYLPDQEIQREIAQKVKQGFELRAQSKQILDNLTLNLTHAI